MIPFWPTQSWFPAVLKLIVATPIIISSSHFQLPEANQRHPLYPQLKLVAFHFSKDKSRHINFLSPQRLLDQHHGGKQPTVEKKTFSCRRKIDPFQPLTLHNSSQTYAIQVLVICMGQMNREYTGSMQRFLQHKTTKSKIHLHLRLK